MFFALVLVEVVLCCDVEVEYGDAACYKVTTCKWCSQ